MEDLAVEDWAMAVWAPLEEMDLEVMLALVRAASRYHYQGELPWP